MPQIFVSYSRVDRPFCADLVGHLREVYGYDSVWFDETLHGGEIWWSTILSHVADCDIFIFLMSREAFDSPYCRAELQEAQRLGKQILPVLIRAKTQIPPDISQVHYVDMQSGITANNLTKLQAAIVRLERKIPPLPPPPLEPEPVAEPIIPASERGKKSSGLPRGLIVFGVVLIAALIGVIALLSSRGGDGEATPPSTTPPTEVAQVSTTETVEPSETLTPSVTPTATLSPTPTITPSFTQTLDIVAVVGTLEAEGTARVRATNIAATATDLAGQTATATLWTFTPTPTATFTPNMTASIEAFTTERAAQTGTAVAATQNAINATLTATHWTATPTHTTTLIPQIALALRGVNGNAEWIPYIIEETPGIMMALVPVGCFMMGSTENEDEQPIHEQCFDEPFWIDVTEVTNAAYGSSGVFEGANRPRERVNWFEARDFCASRAARLPTEREWEYAARGPDGLTYPWGNEFVAENAVYNRSSSEGTANVGSRGSGASWAGVLDMSGNVWEWVSSLYMPYEYATDDGREDVANSTDVRILRGGSWSEDTTNLRAANRGRYFPSDAINYIGFRCAGDFDDTSTVVRRTQAPAMLDIADLAAGESINQDGCILNVSSNFNITHTIFVGIGPSTFPQGTAFYMQFFINGVLYEETNEVTANTDYVDTCVQFNTQNLEVGDYEARIFINGNFSDSLNFVVE